MNHESEKQTQRAQFKEEILDGHAFELIKEQVARQARQVEIQGTQVLWIKMAGVFDEHNRAGFRAIAAEAWASGIRVIVSDLSETGYISSAGLGAMVYVSKEARDKESHYFVANACEDLRTLFELTKLDEIYRLVDLTKPAPVPESHISASVARRIANPLQR